MVDNDMKDNKMNKKEKIINYALNILIGLFSIVLVVSVYNTIQIRIFKNDCSNFFGYSVFEVQTNSMAEYINSNDWIIVKKTDKIKLDDVVTFKEDNEFITHRVIEKYNGTYITKGDANNSKDEPIDQSQIIGKVVKVLPGFGIIRKTLFNKEVLFVLIITLLVINMMYKKKNTDIKELVEEENDNTDSIEDVKEINTLEKIENNIKLIDEDPNNIDINDFINKRMEEEKETEEVVESKNEEEMDTSFDDNYVKVINEEELEKEKVIEEPETKKELIEEIENNIESKDEEFVELDDDILTIDTDKLEQEKLETEENEKIIAEEEAKIEAKKAEKEAKLKAIEEEKERKRIEKELLNQPEQLTQITLERLQEKRKGKKSKNIIDKIMYVKTEQLNEFIDLVNDEDKLLVNEFTIKNELTKAYIDAKFYNEGNSKKKDDLSRIKDYIYQIADNLNSEYKGQDTKYSLKVEKYKNIFELILTLECSDLSGMQNADIRRFYIRTITEYGKDKNWEINKIEDIESKYRIIKKKYIGVIEFLMKNLDTKMFTLEFNALKKEKNCYGLFLKHNIDFDKVYSEDAINDTYSNGIIAEDKMIVLINLLLIQLIKDMILGKFDNKYILNLPGSIYSKKNKFDNVLKMLSDKYAMNNVIFLIDYDDLLKNKEIIKECRKNGYKFALIFNKDLSDTKGFKTNISLVDKIYIDKDNIKETKFNELIPKDFDVIYEDMTNKVGDLDEEVSS